MIRSCFFLSITRVYTIVGISLRRGWSGGIEPNTGWEKIFSLLGSNPSRSAASQAMSESNFCRCLACVTRRSLVRHHKCNVLIPGGNKGRYGSPLTNQKIAILRLTAREKWASRFMFLVFSYKKDISRFSIDEKVLFVFLDPLRVLMIHRDFTCELTCIKVKKSFQKLKWGIISTPVAPLENFVHMMPPIR